MSPDTEATAAFAQKAHGIVNAQIRYRFDRRTVTFRGENLFGEEHYPFINPEISAGSPAAPRRFGVLLSYEY